MKIKTATIIGLLLCAAIEILEYRATGKCDGLFIGYVGGVCVGFALGNRNRKREAENETVES